MKNSEILAASPQFLTSLNKQRQFVLRVEGAPRGCPHCGTEQAKWEIHGIADVDDYNLSDHHGDLGQCKGCGKPIRYCVPLVGDPFFGTIPDPSLARQRQAEG